MSRRNPTRMVNLIGDDLSSTSPVSISRSSQPVLTPINSAPVHTNYGGIASGHNHAAYSSSLVEPVFEDTEVMLSEDSASDSVSSSGSIRRKEAVKTLHEGTSLNKDNVHGLGESDTHGDWVHLQDTHKRSDHLTS